MLKIVEFRTTYRPGKSPVDKVLLAPEGPGFDKTRTWHRVKDLTPPDGVDQRTADSDTHRDMVAKWSIIGPAYEAFKKGEEVPIDGTPLAAWSGVSADQAKFMRGMAILTVENVRDMQEDAIGTLGWPGARQLPKLAAEYLDGVSGAEKDAEITDLREEMAAMRELLEEQAASQKPAKKPKQSEAA